MVQARGTIVPKGFARQVQAETDGVVQRVSVREGATVRKGQILLELDPRDLRARASQLTAELNTTREQLRQAIVMKGATSESLELQNRVAQLQTELNRISNVTEFNGQKLIDGSASSGLTMQVGGNNSSNDRIAMSITKLTTSTLGSTSLRVASAKLDTMTNARRAIGV